MFRRVSLLSVVLTLGSLGEASPAEIITYFHDGIDFWNEPSPSPAVTPQMTPAAEPKSEAKFDWKTHLDPKNPEFFKEGNYTPPEPFMEIVRDPSDENLKNWFTYIEKRNDLARRLSERMAEFMEKSGTAEPVKAAVKTRLSNLSVDADEVKRFRFRFYFDSTCPHCKQMFSTMRELLQRGYFVEARQIDSGEAKDLPMASTRATKDEIEKQGIRSVPYLLIGDLKEKNVYTLTGFQTAQSIFQAIRQRRSS